MHTSQYRVPSDLAGRRVLVVGTGAASGSDIAQDLAGRSSSSTSYLAVTRLPCFYLSPPVKITFFFCINVPRAKPRPVKQKKSVPVLKMSVVSVPVLKMSVVCTDRQSSLCPPASPRASRCRCEPNDGSFIAASARVSPRGFSTCPAGSPCGWDCFSRSTPTGYRSSDASSRG